MADEYRRLGERFEDLADATDVALGGYLRDRGLVVTVAG
jgi:hypothetical protein